jgi:phospholipid/cholesterol/gamma-HCH transport system permease protein
MLDFLASVGRVFLAGVAGTGRFALFALNAISHAFRPPYYPRLVLRQFIDIGYFSLPVVGLTAVFIGMVLALQLHTGFTRYTGGAGAVAQVVVLGMTRELGPVIAGLMVAGRIGAAIAAEIGTMRVTDQIDALSTLSTNPFKYLVVPRLGGTYKHDYNPASERHATVDFLRTDDVVSGLIKAAVFGFIIALMGCYQGYHSRGGAQGVGAATMNAVVGSSILILMFDYILSALLFSS